MSFTDKKLQTMMDMQDTLNSKLNKAWASQGWDWSLAIIDECMEIHGHLGWKWWKDTASYKQGVTDKNRKQVQLEVVDVWHFVLSALIAKGHTAEDIRKDFNSINGDAIDIYQAVDWLMEDAVLHSTPRLSFNSLLHHTGLTWDKLFEIYVGKFALNKFRWDNGYAEGSYEKSWLIPDVSLMYQEDNWYLELILADFAEHGIEVTAEKVQAALQSYYDRMN